MIYLHVHIINRNTIELCSDNFMFLCRAFPFFAALVDLRAALSSLAAEYDQFELNKSSASSSASCSMAENMAKHFAYFDRQNSEFCDTDDIVLKSHCINSSCESGLAQSRKLVLRTDFSGGQEAKAIPVVVDGI